MYQTFQQIINFLVKKDFTKRFSFTFLVLVLYRFSSFISLPGIDLTQIELISNRLSNSMLAQFDLFSGGALSKATIMALNIGPYISASIFFNLLSVVHPYFIALKKEGSLGRIKLNSYIKYSSSIIALFYGYFLAQELEFLKEANKELVLFPGYFFKISSALIFSCSSLIVVWLGEQISFRGIGNGSSLIIYVGILINIPSALRKLFSFSSNYLYLLGILSLIMALLLFIIFIERSFRLIEVRNSAAKFGQKAHIHMKFNPAGIYPVIFAGSFLSIPFIFERIFKISKYDWGMTILANLTHGTLIFTVFYSIAIFLSSFIYSELVFQPEETAENLQKQGIVILNIRAGAETKRFLYAIMYRISALGGLYLTFICIIPEILISKSVVNLYFSGTSFIIVVGVVVDLIDRIAAGVQAQRIEKMMKKHKGFL